MNNYQNNYPNNYPNSFNYNNQVPQKTIFQQKPDTQNHAIQQNCPNDSFQKAFNADINKQKKITKIKKALCTILGVIFCGNILPAVLIKPETSNPNNLKDKDLRNLYIFGSIVESVNNSKTTNYIIEDSEQGKTADCWLLSTIYSINETEKGKEFFKNMFEYKDDETVVHLHVGDYTITDDEVKIGRIRNTKGDEDVLLIELAVEKALADYNQGKIKLPEAVITPALGGNNTFSTLNLGSQDAAIYILTGNSAEYLPIKDNNEKVNYYLYQFENEGKENMSVTASIEEADAGYTNPTTGESYFLRGNHAYCVKKIENGFVTLTNPDNSSIDIEMDIDSFKNIFQSITVADISNIV